jgi:uncharacterized protein (DUF1499 family)
MAHHDRIDFVELKKAKTPNTFLMAPDGLCKNAKVDAVSAVYVVGAKKLRQEFLRIAIAQPRVSISLSDEVGLYDDLVVRSALFGFPDLVSAQFLDAKGGKSSLAVYSRSVYGRSDLGVNRTRTLYWVKLLNGLIKPMQP